MKSKQTQTPKREVRTYAAAHPMTIRTAADGKKQIAGTAIVYNSKSVDLGSFKEIVSPNALTRTLRENGDILALRDHTQSLLLARTTSGTLELDNTPDGLNFVITLPNTAIGDDTAEHVRLRNLTGVSFGFNTREDGWEQDAQGNVTRTLKDIDLFEISITSFAAYPAANVSTRSCPAELKSKLTRSDDEDNEDDPDSEDEDQKNENGCHCDCPECQAGDCSACSASDCDDPDCEGCPMQDDTRTDKLRVRSFFQHKFKKF